MLRKSGVEPCQPDIGRDEQGRAQPGREADKTPIGGNAIHPGGNPGGVGSDHQGLPEQVANRGHFAAEDDAPPTTKAVHQPQERSRRDPSEAQVDEAVSANRIRQVRQRSE